MGKLTQHLARPVHYVPAEPVYLPPGMKETAVDRAERAGIITCFEGEAADGRAFYRLAIFLPESSSRGYVDSKLLVEHSSDGKRGTFHFPEECTCED